MVFVLASFSFNTRKASFMEILSLLAILSALFSTEAANHILKPVLSNHAIVQLSKRTWPCFAYSKSLSSTALSNSRFFSLFSKKLRPSGLSHHPRLDESYPSSFANAFRASPPEKYLRLYFLASFLANVLFPVPAIPDMQTTIFFSGALFVFSFLVIALPQLCVFTLLVLHLLYETKECQRRKSRSCTNIAQV